VRVTRPDKFLQCILWSDHPDEEIKTYIVATITYGTKSTAFLAIRAMQKLALDKKINSPLAAKIVRQDFYVGDFISGGSSVEKAVEIGLQVKQLLAKGNFSIQKWCSNEPAALKGESDSGCEKLMELKDVTSITKALGLAWYPSSDSLLFNFTHILPDRFIIKQSILFMIVWVYDPLEMNAPVVTKLKIFLQAL